MKGHPPMKKKPYSSVLVKEVNVNHLLTGTEKLNADLGLDIGKDWIFAGLRWSDGERETPWKIRNVQEIGDLVALAQKLAVGRQLRIGMEATGTYGDPLRQALADAGLQVHQVGTKAAHDFAEVYDRVPSQHDGKDAAVIAELIALGKGRVWAFGASAAKDEMRYWVRRMERGLKSLLHLVGELEGELMRHWPELGKELKLTSATLLQIVRTYGDPRQLSRDPQAAKKIREWCQGKLSAERIAQLLNDARTSRGVRLEKWACQQLRECAEEAWQVCQRMAKARRELKRLAESSPRLQAMANIVGGPTACVLEVYLGDPRSYDSAQAYRKAMGLNLTERSSGRYQGQLKISKRGQPATRRWLYFAALRWSRKEPAKSWFAAKKEGKGRGRGLLATVAVMRKLALALHQVAVHDEPFDPAKLFALKPPRPTGKSRRRRRRSRRGGDAWE